MYITAQGCRLRNDLYCVEWDVKLYYTIPSCVRWLRNETRPSPSSSLSVSVRGFDLELMTATPVVIIGVVELCLMLLGLYYFYQYLGTLQL